MQSVGLEAAVKSLAGAEAAGSVFNVLLDALAGAAPRGAIFLARQREIRGWSSFGYPAETARRQCAFSAALHGGSLGSVMAGPGTGVQSSRGGDPDFGQAAAHQSILAAVSVKGKPIAAILVERDADELPWDPPAVSVLSAFAGLRLELTLAQRKLLAAERPAEPTDPGRADDPEPVPAAQGPVEVAESSHPELDAARRFARLVATDIRLYNEEAVALGRRHGDLAERLRPSIARGRESFVERHGDLGDAGLELLREAYVAVLAAGDADLLPPSLLR